ncbi:MAG: OmpA family protein [Rectinemataceae bacterium]
MGLQRIPLAACLALVTAVLAGQSPGGPVRFSYTYHQGDRFRVLSTVSEEVLANHVSAGKSEILNRIAYSITEAAPDGKTGRLSGSFVTSERRPGGSGYVVIGEYESDFWRDSFGKYTIDAKYFMPIVRDLPVFPDRLLAPGDSWNAPGQERHDLRQALGIPEPYVIPFECRYRYEGEVMREGRPARLITANYFFFREAPEPGAWTGAWPTEVSGFSDERIWWDAVLGQPIAYEERFRIVFDLSDGTNLEWRGTASSSVVESSQMDRAEMKKQVEEAMSGLKDVTVKEVPEGISISLENIRFSADSATLAASELGKIERIAELLKTCPDRDLIVEGHTALAGTAEGRKELSEERARSVAERLVQLGAREATRIQIQGRGAERPVADNASEAGMARNRRVEIIIREN